MRSWTAQSPDFQYRAVSGTLHVNGDGSATWTVTFQPKFSTLTPAPYVACPGLVGTTVVTGKFGVVEHNWTPALANDRSEIELSLCGHDSVTYTDYAARVTGTPTTSLTLTNGSGTFDWRR